MVVLRFGEAEQQIGSVSDLDSALHVIAAQEVPQLVSLRGGGTVLTIGVNRADWSVALYLDAGWQPSGASSTSPELEDFDGELRFAKGDQTYSFFPRAAIRPSEARRAAREFVATPGVQPTSLTWTPEPGTVD